MQRASVSELGDGAQREGYRVPLVDLRLQGLLVGPLVEGRLPAVFLS